MLLASEAGLVHDWPGKVVKNGRLGPGRMIAIDLVAKKFLPDNEIKETITGSPRFLPWCNDHLIKLHKFAPLPARAPALREVPVAQLLAFGYHLDEREMILTPLAEGLEPTASMGDDTPLAV